MPELLCICEHKEWEHILGRALCTKCECNRFEENK